jgi:hypothetical protein
MASTPAGRSTSYSRSRGRRFGSPSFSRSLILNLGTGGGGDPAGVLDRGSGGGGALEPSHPPALLTRPGAVRSPLSEHTQTPNRARPSARKASNDLGRLRSRRPGAFKRGAIYQHRLTGGGGVSAAVGTGKGGRGGWSVRPAGDVVGGTDVASGCLGICGGTGAASGCLGAPARTSLGTLFRDGPKSRRGALKRLPPVTGLTSSANATGLRVLWRRR